MINNFAKGFRTVVYILLVGLLVVGCKKKETEASVKITKFSFDNESLYNQGDSIYFELSAESNVNVEDVQVSLMVKRNNIYVQVVGKSFVQKIRFPSVSGYIVVPDIEKYDVADFILRAYVGVSDVKAIQEVPIYVRLSNSPLYMAFRKDGSQWRCYNLQGDSLALNLPSTHEQTNWFTVNERRHTLVMYNGNSQNFEQWDVRKGVQMDDLPTVVDPGLVKIHYDRNYDLYFNLYDDHWTSTAYNGLDVVKSATFTGGTTPYAMVGNGGRVAVCMNSFSSSDRGIHLYNYQGQSIGFIQEESSDIVPFSVGGELYVIANRASETVLYALTLNGKGEEITLNRGNVNEVYVDRVMGVSSVITLSGIYELNVSTGALSVINTATNVVSFVAVKSDDLVGFTNSEGVFSARFNSLNGTSKRPWPACLKITYSL